MASENEILGISGHLDISDMLTSFDSILEKLDSMDIKVKGVKENLIRDLQQIEASNDTAAKKQKDSVNAIMEAIDALGKGAQSSLQKAETTLDMFIREAEAQQAKVAKMKADAEILSKDKGLSNYSYSRAQQIRSNASGYEQGQADLEVMQQTVREQREYVEQLKQTKEALQGYANVVKELPEPDMRSPRARLMELRNEITTLKESYADLSDSQKEHLQDLIQEAEGLQRSIRKTNEEIKNGANVNSVFRGLNEALNLIISGYGAAAGVAHELGLNEKDLVEIQTTLQTSLAASNFLMQANTALQKESSLMKVVATVQSVSAAKAIDLENAAKGRGVIATTALTVAQKSFNLVAAANPYVLLATAIISVVGGIYLLTKSFQKNTEEEEKAKKITEELNKKHQEWASSVASSAGKSIAAYKKLQHEWNALANNMEGKRKFIKNHQNSFHELGFAVKSVSDAENILVQNTDNVVNAILARAKAAAYEKMLQEDIEKQIKEQESADLANNSVKGGKFQHYARVGQNASKDSKDVYAEALRGGYKYKAGDIDKNGNWTAIGAKRINYYAGVDKESRAQEVAKADEKRNKQHEEYQKRITDKIYEQQQKAQQFSNATGVKGWTEENKTSSTDNKNREEDLQKANERYKEIVRKNALEREKREHELNQRIIDAQLETEKDGAKKVQEERKRANEKELDDIEQQRQAVIEDIRKGQKEIWEAKQAIVEEKGGKASPFVFNANAEEVVVANAQFDDLVDATKQRQLNDQRKQELESMREYLRQYGDAEQQKLAITEEYEEKINNAIGANDPYKAASLMEERDKKIKEVNASEIYKNLDWDSIFSNIQNYDAEFLKSIEGQLEKAIKQGIEKGISAADLKVLGDKLQEVRDLFASRTTGIFDNGRLLGSSWLGNVAQQRSAQQRREERAADAEKNLSQARTKEQKANDKRDLAELNLREMMSKHPMDSKEVKEAEANLEKAKTDATQAAVDAKEADKKALAAASEAKVGAKMTAFAITDAIIHGVNDNLQSANTMFQEWGIGSDEFREKFALFADSSAKATQAFDSLKQGDVFGTIYNLGEAVSSLGESFGLWSNSNVAEKEAEIEERQNANKELVKALKDLTDAFKNSDLTNGIKTFEQAQGVLQTQIRNAQEAADAKGDEYSGHHSTNYYSGEFGRQMRELYKRTFGNTEGLIDGGQGYDDFVYLDPAKLREMRMKDPEAWANAINALRNADKANLGVADMFVSLVDDFGTAMEDLERQWKETLTNLSWDSLKSSFASALKDMGKELKDWNNDVDDILRSSVSNFVASQYTSTGADGKPKGRVTEWYDKLAKYMQGEEGTSNKPNLDATEAADLRTEWIGITRDANAEVEKLYEMLDLDDVSSSEAQGTINGIKSISDDTANEIVGRLTAMQISVERNSIILEEQLAQQGAQVTSLQSIEAYTANINGNVVNITENVRTIVESQNAMNMHLANISANTEVLPGMYREITRMRTKIDTL